MPVFLVSENIVTTPLFERGDLSILDAQQANRFALSWLDQYQRLPDAAFVLPRLLSQRGIRPDDAYSLIRSAVNWLEVFYEAPGAEFVLKNLFRREDVPLEARASLLGSAIQRPR